VVRRVEFRIPRKYPLQNELLRMSRWKRAAEQKRIQHEVADATIGMRLSHPMQRAFVKIVRHSPGMPDQDGLTGGAKLLIDCLTTPKPTKTGNRTMNKHGLGFVVDDGPKHIVLECEAHRSKKHAQCTIVIIEELGEEQEADACRPSFAS